MTCFVLDFYTNEVPLQFGGLQPGVVKTQDPPIERDLNLSLDDLFHGCTKKIKISRRVRVFVCWITSITWIYFLIYERVVKLFIYSLVRLALFMAHINPFLHLTNSHNTSDTTSKTFLPYLYNR